MLAYSICCLFVHNSELLTDTHIDIDKRVAFVVQLV